VPRRLIFRIDCSAWHNCSTAVQSDGCTFYDLFTDVLKYPQWRQFLTDDITQQRYREAVDSLQHLCTNIEPGITRKPNANNYFVKCIMVVHRLTGSLIKLSPSSDIQRVSAKSRVTSSKIRFLEGQGHPRSSMVVPIEVVLLVNNSTPNCGRNYFRLRKASLSVVFHPCWTPPRRGTPWSSNTIDISLKSTQWSTVLSQT